MKSSKKYQRSTNLLVIPNMTGEVSGDIPMISLYKTFGLFQKSPPRVTLPTLRTLIFFLQQENEKYKKDLGRMWNCLPLRRLLSVFEVLEGFLTSKIKEDLPQGMHESAFHERDVLMSTLKCWFRDNITHIEYSFKIQHIPHPIKESLREEYSQWVRGEEKNPFSEPIDAFICRVARKNGIATESSREAWILLGGVPFK
jgi:hypothetical protein